MDRSRRRFLQQSFLAVAGSAAAPALARIANDPAHLVLLTTNDTHARLDPFAENDARYPGLGGIDRRARLVNRIRSAHPHVLVLDAGDMFAGARTCTASRGVPEVEAMSALGYDAGTIGNHEFDNGLTDLATALDHAGFPLVNANLENRGTPVEGSWRPSIVRERGDFRVGIFGLCCPLEGMVPPRHREGIAILDTLETARTVSTALRAAGCNLIVCLSHLGYTALNEPSDRELARAAPEIDIIVGGHSHTFLDEPVWTEHPRHPPTLITQQGWAGVRLGRIDVRIDANREVAALPTFLPVAD